MCPSVIHGRADRVQDFFMHDPNADKLRRVKGEIEQVKTAMIQNLGPFRGICPLI